MAIIPSSSNNKNGKSPEAGKVPGDATPKNAVAKEAVARESAAKEPAVSLKRNSLLSGKETTSDRKSELQLRPQYLSEYIGQARVKSMLEMSIAAAKKRQEPLDHVLFYGPPGLGKTTLASVIANEMGAKIHLASAPGLERPRDIIGLVHQLEAGDVLFIDEVHRLSRVTEELLYSVLEDFVIDLTSGKGHSTRSMRLSLPRFTLVGATTKAAMLSNALRDRFGFVLRLEMYTPDELQEIVDRTSKLLALDTTLGAVKLIATRARGTPRIANRLVRLVRDFAHFKNLEQIDETAARAAMETYQVDGFGLDPTDRKLLATLIDNYGGGPVGLDTLAATLGEDSNTIEDVYEPYLIQSGFLLRTPRGRVAAPRAYEHLGKTLPPGQLNLNFDATETEME